MELGTLMLVGTVVSAMGTAFSAYSSYTQAQGQAAASRQSAAYAQMMANRNQEIANLAAGQAEQKGRYEAMLMRERAESLLGKQSALFGKAGVDLAGSPLEFMSESAAKGERDALMAEYGGKYEAWKYRTSGETSLLEGEAAASRFNTEASLFESRGYNALWSAPFAIGSSILTGYGRYQGAKKGYNPYGWGY